VIRRIVVARVVAVAGSKGAGRNPRYEVIKKELLWDVAAGHRDVVGRMRQVKALEVVSPPEPQLRPDNS
jgi:hypothetical protein